MVLMSREEVLKKYGGVEWISPYERIIAMHDGSYVEIHEFHARGKCVGGAAWETYHYPRVSNLVLKARREGARNIFVLKKGETTLKLVPGIAGAGIEKVEVGENVEVTYAGLAGGGIAATVCRGMAENVLGIEILEEGGGEKLGKAKLVLPAMEKVVIGVDDTDSKEGGATWALVNEIAYKIEKENLGYYLLHTITQLYTKNPYKTTNCVSISVTFATQNSEKLVKMFENELKKSTFSDETAMAVYKKILVSEELLKFGEKVKREMVEIEEAEDIAKRNNVELIEITGRRGVIGALAAVAYSDLPDEAVRVYA
nr:methanogenesis marker protein 11 [Ferroglobus sp.]